jgi:Flp pilus assembly protein TadD
MASNEADGFANQGRFRDAAEAYRLALRTATGDVVADLRNNLGIALANQGRLREARTEFATAVSLRPGFTAAQANLARADAALGDLNPPE